MVNLASAVAAIGAGAWLSRVLFDQQALDLFYNWISKLPGPKPSPSVSADREETAALIARLQTHDSTRSAARADAVDKLISSTSRALALSRAKLPAEVWTNVLAAVKDRAPVEVRDVFERFIPESERIKRLGDAVDPMEILALPGDAGRGRAVFTAESVVNCKSCHRLEGVGVEIGPDLSKIGAKYPRPELLRQMLEPSRTIDPKYTLYQIETRAGLVHSGLLARRDDKEIVLRDAQNQEVRIAVPDVEVFSSSKQSLMPDLLLRSLTAQQAADLLEYLASRK